MENINLDILPKDGARMLRELEAGNMVVARSKNDFLYILDFNGSYHMFSHTPGSPGGGQRQFPKNDKYHATIRKIADLSDSAYLVEFDKSMNIYGVMSSAEEGILTMFPGEDRDADGTIEFTIPGEDKSDGEE